MNLGKIVSQVLPPLNKFVGWLVPTDKEHIDLRFWHNGEWRSVSPGTSSGGGGTGGDGITDIECNATYPLILSASTEDNKTTIVGSVDLDGYAQIDSIPTKVSQLENDANYLTNSDMVPITIEEVDALFD